MSETRSVKHKPRFTQQSIFLLQKHTYIFLLEVFKRQKDFVCIACVQIVVSSWLHYKLTCVQKIYVQFYNTHVYYTSNNNIMIWGRRRRRWDESYCCHYACEVIINSKSVVVNLFTLSISCAAVPKQKLGLGNYRHH